MGFLEKALHDEPHDLQSWIGIGDRHAGWKEAPHEPHPAPVVEVIGEGGSLGLAKHGGADCAAAMMLEHGIGCIDQLEHSASERPVNFFVVEEIVLLHQAYRLEESSRSNHIGASDIVEAVRGGIRRSAILASEIDIGAHASPRIQLSTVGLDGVLGADVQGPAAHETESAHLGGTPGVICRSIGAHSDIRI